MDRTIPSAVAILILFALSLVGAASGGSQNQKPNCETPVNPPAPTADAELSLGSTEDGDRLITREEVK